MTLSCFLMVRRTPDVTLIAPLFPFKTRLRAPVVCLSLGLSMRYLSVIVLIPLKGVFFRSSNLGWNGMIEVIFSPRVLAALRLSFGSALIGALINAVFGTLVAWVFVRYRFAGKRFFDALIDLPFALPTAVAGKIGRAHV